MKTIDIISIGEVLIDFIGHEVNTSINKTKDYHRFLGGSPTNVAVNASRLGLKTVLVASCGQDGLGDYIVRKLKSNHVNTDHIRKSDVAPTSVIFVSKSTDTPDFIAYRQADCEIYEDQLPDGIIESAKIFHTTCFALSFTFSKLILKEYLANDPLVKLSEDDCYRLFAETKSEEYIFDYFHGLGVTTICLTKGKNGVVVSDLNNGLFFQKALEIHEIKDTTGAGDAFWTGFLYAQIQNKTIEESMSIAQKLAAIKLQNVGRLPDNINLNQILQG